MRTCATEKRMLRKRRTGEVGEGGGAVESARTLHDWSSTTWFNVLLVSRAKPPSLCARAIKATFEFAYRVLGRLFFFFFFFLSFDVRFDKKMLVDLNENCKDGWIKMKLYLLPFNSESERARMHGATCSEYRRDSVRLCEGTTGGGGSINLPSTRIDRVRRFSAELAERSTSRRHCRATGANETVIFSN